MKQKSLTMYQLNYLFGEARILKSLCNNTGGTFFFFFEETNTGGT